MRNQEVWNRQGGVPRRLSRRGNNRRLQRIITGDQERHWRQVRHHENLHNRRQQRNDCDRRATATWVCLPAGTPYRTVTAPRHRFTFAGRSSRALGKLMLVAARAQARFGSLVSSGLATPTQVAFAERLVLAIGANAGHPGCSSHERDRDHRPDQRRPEVLPNGAHLSKSDEPNKLGPCIVPLRPEPVNGVTIYQRRPQDASTCPNSTLNAPSVQYGCKYGAVLPHLSVRPANHARLANFPIP